MENVAILADIQQAKISDEIRTLIRRIANKNGGLAARARAVGINAHRYYNQLNRGNGVLVETVALEYMQGNDEPLRIVADACGCDVQPKMKFLRKALSPKPVRSYGLAIHHAATRITILMEEALADQRLDEHERQALKARVHEARKALAAFEARISGDKP